MVAGFRQIAVREARQLWEVQPVFLDTETTGLHRQAEIVEICIVDYDGSILLDTLVKPHGPIPFEAFSVHGITDHMVKDANPWNKIWPEVEEILTNRYVGIYNAEFDLKMIRQSHRLHGMPWRPPASRFFCVMNLYSDFCGSRKWQKLDAAGRQCRIPLPNSHRARDDALLTRAIFVHMVNGGR